MPTFKEDLDHLSYLASGYRKLAKRTDQARQSAIGWSELAPGTAHDAAINEQIDWFDRRWVQRVEKSKEWMLFAAEGLERARETYRLTEDKVRRSVEPAQPVRRQGADL